MAKANRNPQPMIPVTSAERFAALATLAAAFDAVAGEQEDWSCPGLTDT